MASLSFFFCSLSLFFDPSSQFRLYSESQLLTCTMKRSRSREGQRQTDRANETVEELEVCFQPRDATTAIDQCKLNYMSWNHRRQHGLLSLYIRIESITTEAAGHIFNTLNLTWLKFRTDGTCHKDFFCWELRHFSSFLFSYFLCPETSGFLIITPKPCNITKNPYWPIFS